MQSSANTFGLICIQFESVAFLLLPRLFLLCQPLLVWLSTLVRAEPLAIVLAMVGVSCLTALLAGHRFCPSHILLDMNALLLEFLLPTDVETLLPRKFRFAGHCGWQSWHVRRTRGWLGENRDQRTLNVAREKCSFSCATNSTLSWSTDPGVPANPTGDL